MREERTGDPPNALRAVPAPSIPIYETNPPSIMLHRIEDHELEALTNISRPIALALAGTATGGFLGLTPGAITAYARIGTTQFTVADFAAGILCAACVVLAALTWPSAIKGQLEANRAIKRIRERSPTQV